MLKRDVLFVSGSPRRGSYNTALLCEAANALPSGVGLVWLDGIAELPSYCEDDDGERTPAAVERLRRTIGAADAVLGLATGLREVVSALVDAPPRQERVLPWSSRAA